MLTWVWMLEPYQLHEWYMGESASRARHQNPVNTVYYCGQIRLNPPPRVSDVVQRCERLKKRSRLTMGSRCKYPYQFSAVSNLDCRTTLEKVQNEQLDGNVPSVVIEPHTSVENLLSGKITCVSDYIKRLATWLTHVDIINILPG